MPIEQDPEMAKDTNNSTGNNILNLQNTPTRENTISSSANEVNTASTNQTKLISLAIKDLKVLYTAYMPFVINGGLFIPTKKVFNMGDCLPLLIALMEESNKYSVTGKVVWITPSNVNNRTPGIGVEFLGEAAVELYTKINRLLETFTSKEPTNTM